ncbi:MAG: beta-phosphoglucomutase family hydrolase, partial [Alphaproteobacteria bacterium]|nr:beta-phosphoglucomutase family hydrolase [Alphaproteobacteria bacterium]
MSLDAVIFDMDGVITDTAEAHFNAWKTVFDDFLVARGHIDEPFTRRDYLDHVDGVPRHDGIQRFLASRGIDLPEGREDAGTDDSVHGLGNLKNKLYRRWLHENVAPTFDDAMDLVAGLKEAGIAVGVFSASRNARAVLESAGIADLFQVIVDGVDAGESGLAAKPDPAVLVETVTRLGTEPSRAAVVEDSISGIQAARRGGFQLVIGVNRQEQDADEQRHALREHGADTITSDLRRVLLPDSRGLRMLARLAPVWDRLDEFKERVAGRGLGLFLDYDGTLSPIVEDYHDAVLPEKTREVVEGLARLTPVAVISGRDLQDVRARVGVEDVVYAGSHGFDIAGPGGLHERPEQAEKLIEP